MSTLPNCPKCNSQYVYEDNNLYICPECAHEWSLHAELNQNENEVKDSNGAVLNDGDSIIVIKDLKVKGSSTPIKKGTKIKNILLTEGDHNIDCKVPGMGSIQLKSEFVKKG